MRDLTVEHLPASTYTADVARVDQRHSNIVPRLPTTTDWPDAEQMATLRANDVLDTEPLGVQTPVNGVWQIDLEVPMPGVVRVRLSAGDQPADTNEERAR